MAGNPGFSLASIGLSTDADVVWRALLRVPDLTLRDLCAQVDLSLTVASHAIEELATAGFLQRANVPLGWIPVEPSMAIEQRVAHEQCQLAARLAELSALRTGLPDLTAAFSRGRERLQPRMEMEILEGLEAIRGRLATVCANAKTEALSMHTAVSTEGLKMSRALDFGMLARGVVGRTLVDAATLEDSEHVAYLEELSGAGEQIRVIRVLPARALIIDRELAIVPVDAADVKRAALVVRAHTIVDCMVALFEQLWAVASPLFNPSDARGRPEGRPAQVLELLAMGRKDESIARSLGVGVRTVRRDIAALMASLGERTRPAAVAAAIRHGWLPAASSRSDLGADAQRRHDPA